ncbi:hypothetical protein [Zunongwangia sp. H14]|uniref:hypothetical protein n=1 Tax=Zunongwangia sp. H14 TaxID=3240792 RepID=UPI0035695196
MKFLKAYVILFLIGWSTCAQIKPIQVQKSEIQKDDKKDSELMFTAYDGNGGFYTARMYSGGLIKSPKGYLLQHYDKSLQQIGEYDYEIDDSSIKSFFVKDGKLNIIEYKRDRSANVNDYNLLTTPVGEFSFEKKKIFSVSRKDVKKPFMILVGILPITNMGSVDHDPTGEVYLSEDKNFITFNFDLKDDQEETHLVKVYNDKLELVFEKEFKQEGIKDRLFEYNSVTTDNEDGTVYFLGKQYESERAKKDGKANYEYKLFSLSAEGMRELSFNTGENFVGSMELVNNQDNLVCVGFYSEKNDYRYKGTVYYNINKENFSLRTSSLNPFTEQFMVDKYGEKRGKRKKEKGKELRDFTYRGFHIDEEGNTYFTAEEYYVVTHMMSGMNGMMTTTTTFYFKDIFACKINTEGKMQWARNFNKSQATAGKAIDYYSCLSTYKDDRLIILLNGSDKVKKLKDNRIRFDDKKVKKLSLYAIEILPDGDFDYEQIINNKESKVTYKVAEGIVTNNKDAIILEGNKGKKKRIVKLTL